MKFIWVRNRMVNANHIVAITFYGADAVVHTIDDREFNGVADDIIDQITSEDE